MLTIIESSKKLCPDWAQFFCVANEVNLNSPLDNIAGKVHSPGDVGCSTQASAQDAKLGLRELGCLVNENPVKLLPLIFEIRTGVVMPEFDGGAVGELHDMRLLVIACDLHGNHLNDGSYQGVFHIRVVLPND